MEHRQCLSCQVGTPSEVLVPLMTRALEGHQKMNKQAIIESKSLNIIITCCELIR